MNPETLDIKAHLFTGKKRIPIAAKCNSKYSLLVRFLNADSFIDGAEFGKLIMQINGTKVELGPCRLFSEPEIKGYDGRLVFAGDVYDFRALFSHGRLIRLQTAFLNLPLLLAYKEKIKPAFKDYAANLLYDLNVYKTLFDEIDMEYSNEPENIQRFIQKAIIDTEGRKFMRFLDEKLEELEQIVASFTKEEHERHGFYFRKQLWNIILCSSLMKRTNLKPRGYAGDSEMMRMIYSNDYEGESTFSKLMHKHPLDATAARAVRQRRKIIAQKLTEIQTRVSGQPREKARALSVACGPAFELKDVLSSSADCEKYHFTFLDQDDTALHEAATLVNGLEKRLGAKIAASYLNASVRTMVANRQLLQEWGQFHFVYSMGLFDYLTPPVATAVLTKLYQLVKPGGEMLIGNFHISNPSKYYMAYWNDWVIYHRTEEEFTALLRRLPSAEGYIFYEETESQMFLHIRRPESQLARV